MTNEYREAVEDAKDALQAVIQLTEPGTGMTLHEAYTCLKDTLESAQEPSVEPDEWSAPDPAARHDKWREAEQDRQAVRAARKALTWHDRERIILEAIGDAAISQSDLTWQVRQAYPELKVVESYLYPWLKHMVASGELRRQPSGLRGRQTHWHYMRNTDLTGAIADLERALTGGDV